MSRIYQQPPKPWNANIQAAVQGKPDPSANKPLPTDDLRRVVEQVGDAWQHVYGKEIYITGARGFIGRWMFESVMTALRGDSGRWPNVWTVNEYVEKWWPYHKPDYIIHATTDGVGWQHVAAVARAAGAKMLLLSSGAVYGNGWKDACCEMRQQPGAGMGDMPATDCGRQKRDQEGECAAVIARLFSFIGPGLRRHVGREFLEADPITVNDDGAVRSYLYASDMAVWLWRCLLLGKVGRAYNVGSGEAIKVTDFAKRCSDIREMERVRKGVQEINGTYYVPDVSRAERELGCRQTVGLDEAIRRTLAWQRA